MVIVINQAQAKVDIWDEHYTPIIGSLQVDYMLKKYQSVPAIEDQVRQGVEYYLLNYESIPVGYLSFFRKEDSLFLNKLYVLSSYRGKGIGKKAMSFIEHKTKELGCDSISLTVNKYNTNSIKAYEQMGFKNIKAVVQNIGNDFVMDDYFMEKKIVC